MTPTRRGFFGMVAGVLGALGLSRLAVAAPARNGRVLGVYRDELALIKAVAQQEWERGIILCWGRDGRVVHTIRRAAFKPFLHDARRFVLPVQFWNQGAEAEFRLLTPKSREWVALRQTTGPDLRPLDAYLSYPRWHGMLREDYVDLYAELRG